MSRSIAFGAPVQLLCSDCKMSVMRKRRRETLIDTAGNEWLHAGTYSVVGREPYGWVNLYKERDFIHLSDVSRIIHVGDDNRPDWGAAHLLSPNFFEAGSAECPYGELWSLPENRLLISGVLCIFDVDEELGLVSLVTMDKHLQVRTLNNEIVEDFGVMPEKSWPYEDDTLFSDKRTSISMAKEINGRMAFVSMNLYTGKEYGEPYLCLGSLREGLRYMMRPDGSECFVNSRNEWAFDLLPSPRKYNGGNPHLDSLQLYVRRYICSKGKIVADCCGKNGKIQSYLLDREGNILLPPGKCPSYMYGLGEDRFAVRRRNSIALANEKGELMTDYLYSLPWLLGLDCDAAPGLGFFSEGLCALTKKKGSRFHTVCIDSDGNEVIPFDKYTEIGCFSHGYALAKPQIRGVDWWG